MTAGQLTQHAAERQTPPQVSLAAIVRKSIERQAPRFNAILPAGFDHTRFYNLVLSAVKKKPGLLECFSTPQGEVTVLLSAMEAASIGLEPDTPMQEAWLLPQRNKGVMECRLSIGYQGLVKLARRSGEIKSLRADVVKEGDVFAYSFGLEADVMRHEPAPSDKRGELLYAYAVVRYMNGGYDFVVLDKGEIHERRSRSDSWKSETGRKYSPWVTSTAAMWKKTAVRDLAKLMPKSAEFARADANDERSLSFDEDDGSVVAASDDEVQDAEIIEDDQ